MATVTITEGTDVIESTITKEDSNNLDVLEVSVPNSFIVSIGDTVTYKDESATTIFTGIVQNIKVGGIKELLVYDHSSQLLNRTVNEIYSSQSPEAIIEDIVTTYTDLTYTSTISSGTTIDKLVIKDKRAWDVIQELLEILNANTRTSINKVYTVELKETGLSTESLTTGTDILDGGWEQNSDQLVNSVILRGDRQIFDTDETFNGNASDTEFTLADIPIDVRVEHPVGTELTGYVTDASTGDYTVDRENKKITFDSAPSSGTNNIQVWYTYSVEIKVTSRDPSSISTYGRRDKKIEKPYINSFTEARKFVKNYLAIFATPLQQSTWIIANPNDWANYLPNERITVNDSIFNISGQFVIKKVEREYPGLTKVTVGDQQDDILDWNKEVQYRIKQLEEKDDNSTILQEYQLVQEGTNISAVVKITRYQYRDKGSCFYLGDDANGLLRETATPYSITLCEEATGNSWTDIT